MLDIYFGPFAMGFLEADFNDAMTELIAWGDEIRRFGSKGSYGGDGQEMVRALGPLAAPSTRVIGWKTHSRWCALASNHRLLGPPPDIDVMSERLKCRGVWCSWSPRALVTLRVTLGSMDVARWISVEGSDATSVRESGTRLPFERGDRYFDRSVLVEYLHALDIDAFDGAFYGPAGSLFELASEANAEEHGKQARAWAHGREGVRLLRWLKRRPGHRDGTQ